MNTKINKNIDKISNIDNNDEIEDEEEMVEDIFLQQFDYYNNALEEKQDNSYDDINNDDILPENLLNNICFWIYYYFSCDIDLISEDNRIIIGYNDDDIKSMLDLSLCIYKKDNERHICMYINELNKGTYNGIDLLERLELLCITLKINYIMLQDESSKIYNIANKSFKINLGMISILTRCNSWYNQLGFYQYNYKEENEYWNSIYKDNILFKDIILTLKSLDYNYYLSKVNKSWYNDGLELFAEYHKILIDESNFKYIMEGAINFILNEYTIYSETNISTVCGLISITLKSDNSYQDEKSFIIAYLYISLCSYVILYTRTNLVKKIL